MVVEGLRQLGGSDFSPTPSGYQLQYVPIHNPLIFDDTSAAGVEVRTFMRPTADGVLRAQGWYDFQIQSVDTQSKWTIHCEGQCTTTAPQSVSEWVGPAFVDSGVDNQAEQGGWRTIDPGAIHMAWTGLTESLSAAHFLTVAVFLPPLLAALIVNATSTSSARIVVFLQILKKALILATIKSFYIAFSLSAEPVHMFECPVRASRI